MKTGIIILNYNDYETTEKILDKIKNYASLDVIVVVDNNSTDNSYELLKRYESEKIIVLKSDKNKGYAAGNNIGCKYLTNIGVEYIIVSNPDIIFEDDDIKKLVANFSRENIGIVAPRVNEHGKINRGWKNPNVLIDSLSNLNYIGYFFKKQLLYRSNVYLSKTTEVDVVSGCFFIIKTDVMKRVNYFDENVFLYYEENILAKKVSSINYKTVVDNTVEIVHESSVTINKSIKKISRFRLLCKSQRYYHVEYNDVGVFGQAVLYFTYYIALGVSYIESAINHIWEVFRGK
ncbi:MAG: glycosyltransferase family 2 protein [Lachnospiraceae bacterium]|jgi:GT2 family glycosyltransferase|nr:glycosyltransferase family 2 protein [Lachnospiraceae bacterium]